MNLRIRTLGPVLLVCSFAILIPCAGAQDEYIGEFDDESVPAYSDDMLIVGPEMEARDTSEHSTLHKVVMYVPNRVFDLFDIFRLRARVGPGLAASVRITKPVSVFLGSYAAIWAGLPGPRQEPTLPLPIGFETNNGASLSYLDATVGYDTGPTYSDTEIGIGIHPIIFGIDIGIDPWEIVDFFGGFVGFDVRVDDL